jgi:hypothetical protein
MTQSGIKPANFRLLAQCFNKLCHLVPQFILLLVENQMNAVKTTASNKEMIEN